MPLSRDELIDTLNYNASLEHEAILSYLLLAWSLTEHEVAGKLESLAREEMQHMKWLCHAIVRLGGKPDLTPPALELAGRTALEILRGDAQHEARVIAEYREQMTASDHPRVNNLLWRLIVDSERHAEVVSGIIARLEAEVPAGEAATSDSPAWLVALSDVVAQRYRAILQTLYHSFLNIHSEIGVELENQAVDYMHHLEWLGEAAMEQGAWVELGRPDYDRSTRPAHQLQADLALSREVQAQAESEAAAVLDPEMARRLERVAEHDRYNQRVIEALLAGLEPSPAAGVPQMSSRRKFTVGNLFEADQ